MPVVYAIFSLQAFDLIYSVVNIELSYVKFKTLIYRRDFRLVFVLFHGNQVTVTG